MSVIICDFHTSLWVEFFAVFGVDEAIEWIDLLLKIFKLFDFFLLKGHFDFFLQLVAVSNIDTLGLNGGVIVQPLSCHIHLARFLDIFVDSADLDTIALVPAGAIIFMNLTIEWIELSFPF